MMQAGDQVIHIASRRGYTILDANVTYISDAGLTADGAKVSARHNITGQILTTWAGSFMPAHEFYAQTRCTEHPAFDADNCPGCGTEAKIGVSS